jgi:hypothetical protein
MYKMHWHRDTCKSLIANTQIISADSQIISADSLTIVREKFFVSLQNKNSSASCYLGPMDL